MYVCTLTPVLINLSKGLLLTVFVVQVQLNALLKLIYHVVPYVYLEATK